MDNYVNRNLVVGIDSGASKTKVFLADEAGNILSSDVGGAANPNACGMDKAVDTIANTVKSVFVKAGSELHKVKTLAIGIAGVDNPYEEKLFLKLLQKKDLAEKIIVSHDGHLLIYAGTPDGWGVGIVSGTGSIMYGLNKAKKPIRVGGWGRVIGDEGSGYFLGAETLRAVIQSYDGRLQKTMLSDEVLRHFDIDTPECINHLVNSSTSPLSVAEIARLSVILFRCAGKGDVVALAIRDRAARDLCLGICTLIKRMNVDGDIPCAISGGVLINENEFRDQVLQMVEKQGVKLNPINLVTEPALGAIKIAVNE